MASWNEALPAHFPGTDAGHSTAGPVKRVDVPPLPPLLGPSGLYQCEDLFLHERLGEAMLLAQSWLDVAQHPLFYRLMIEDKFICKETKGSRPRVQGHGIGNEQERFVILFGRERDLTRSMIGEKGPKGRVHPRHGTRVQR